MVIDIMYSHGLGKLNLLLNRKQFTNDVTLLNEESNMVLISMNCDAVSLCYI